MRLREPMSGKIDRERRCLERIAERLRARVWSAWQKERTPVSGAEVGGRESDRACV